MLPATIFFLTYYMAFILLAGYAEDFMASSVYEGLTVGYCLALTQFLMVFVLGILYLRKADREYDPLAQRVLTTAGDDGGETGRAAESRFARREAGRRSTRRAAMTVLAAVNVEAVVIFAIVLWITLGITYWASKRPGAPSASTPPAARSPASRTGSRSPATTCRPPRSWASPA